MKKQLLLGVALFAASLPGFCQKNLPYKNPKLTIEERVNDLLSRMTLEEKILQLNQLMLGPNDNFNNIVGISTPMDPRMGSMIYIGEDPVRRNEFQKKAVEGTRLGIPLIYGYDVIHGYRSVFPIPVAMACSWNPSMLTACNAIAAQEARQSGVDWAFSPMIDIARDPRWGRIAEGYGEDPYTASVFVQAAVKGFQGTDLTTNHNLAACLKHYVGYGASEAGRDYVYSEISDQTLWDTYLPPYEAGVKAGAQTLMSSFNDISGIPGSANHYTLTEILKNKWGHDGFVVSDWNAVTQLVNQGFAADDKEAAMKAINAGVEMDMTDGAYYRYLNDLVKEGKVSEKQIDESVRRILRVKFRLGLFEHPYTQASTEKERFLLPASLKTVEKAAEESMVLLKNEKDILPLNTQIFKKIALIGPMVKDAEDQMGSWNGHGHAEDVTTIYDAFLNEFNGKAEFVYSQGCDLDKEIQNGFDDAVKTALEADLVILCLGEKNNWSGENGSRSTILLPEIQRNLLAAVSKTGKPVILLLNNGRPLELSGMDPLTKAILECWQPGISGGKAAAGILSGRVNPSGKLCVTFPYTSGQIPIYYNRRNPARKPTQGFYQDVTVEPMYPFGYGLSYTTFKYGELKISTNSVKQDGILKAQIDVTNTGKNVGKETVHWFISDPACSITRPMKELKYFEKAELQPGETKTFTFDIDVKRDFGYVDRQGNYFIEPGDIYLMVKDQKVKITVE